MKTYDLAVIGAGLAGAVAAVVAAEAGLDVLVLEKGHGPGDRRNLVNGWLGRALYTMGRLDAGDTYFFESKRTAFDTAFELCRDANGGKLECRQGGYIPPENLPLQSLARLHYSAEPTCGREMAQRLHKRLLAPGTADLLFGADANRVEWDTGRFVLHTRRGKLLSQRCLVATGGHSVEWVRDLCTSISISAAASHVRLGIRVEVPERLLRTFIRVAGDLCLSSAEGVLVDDARIGSAVGDREDNGLLSAFAHTPPGKRAERTSFMVSLDLGNNFEEMVRLVRIANILSNDKVRRERAVDFVDGHSALKHLKQFDPLRLALRNLDRMVPSLLECATVYIPEIRIGGTLPTDERMRTVFPGLYGAGECVPKVDGLLDAMASALVSAQSVMEDRNG
jgi:glycine/D-amino acid oxidase-like deaminating enzyme